MDIAHQIRQMKLRGNLLGSLPVYAVRMAEYAWISAVPKKSILRLRFGSTKFGMNFRPMGQGEGARGMFMFRERYEPLLTHGYKLLNTGDVALDVGANQGLFTAAFGAMAGTVVAVEPIPWQAERVRANIKLNGYKQAHVVEAAISDKPGEATLSLGGGDTSASIVGEGGGKSITVKTVTLDGIIDQFKLGRVDLVKLDVEGAELMALDGGKRLLAEFRPVLCLEASDPEMFGKIVTRLKGAGYSMYRFDRTGRLNRLAEVTGWIDNVFFLTAEHEKRYASLIQG